MDLKKDLKNDPFVLLQNHKEWSKNQAVAKFATIDNIHSVPLIFIKALWLLKEGISIMTVVSALSLGSCCAIGIDKPFRQ